MGAALLCDVCEKDAEFIVGGVGFCEGCARAFLRGDVIVPAFGKKAAQHRDEIRALLKVDASQARTLEVTE